MLLQMYQFFVLQRRRSYCFEAKYMPATYPNTVRLLL